MAALAKALVNPPKAATQKPQTASRNASFFGVDAILRSLVLFNLLFAVQTILDVIYLWGNTTLPPDISYATYAHRGAYPLILTALLAAGFVLAAMQRGGPAEHSRVIRPPGLSMGGAKCPAGTVVDSAARSLCPNLSADLVAHRRFHLDGAGRAGAAAHRCPYRVEPLERLADPCQSRDPDGDALRLLAGQFRCHYRRLQRRPQLEPNDKGVWIDMDYLFSLGPQALPAIDRAMALRGFDLALVSRRGCLVEQQAKQMASWRSWGFRSWRLQRALDAEPKSMPAG